MLSYYLKCIEMGGRLLDINDKIDNVNSHEKHASKEKKELRRDYKEQKDHLKAEYKENKQNIKNLKELSMTNVKGRIKNNLSGFLRFVVIGMLILVQVLFILSLRYSASLLRWDLPMQVRILLIRSPGLRLPCFSLFRDISCIICGAERVQEDVLSEILLISSGKPTSIIQKERESGRSLTVLNHELNVFPSI